MTNLKTLEKQFERDMQQLMLEYGKKFIKKGYIVVVNTSMNKIKKHNQKMRG